MAAGDVSNRKVSTYGAKMVATGTVEHGTGADYSFDTGLSFIDQFSICWSSSADGPDFIAFLNTNTNSDNAAGYGGQVYIDADTGTWGSDGESYTFTAVGK